jgi:hypothetical protein
MWLNCCAHESPSSVENCMKALGITQNVVADGFRVDRMADDHSCHFDEWFVRADSFIGRRKPKV